MGMKRRAFLRLTLPALVAPGLLAGLAGAQPAELVIPMVAKKFDFVPSELKLKLGVPVVLEIVAPDVTMGFSAPDLGLNVSIAPGKPVLRADHKCQVVGKDNR